MKSPRSFCARPPFCLRTSTSSQHRSRARFLPGHPRFRCRGLLPADALPSKASGLPGPCLVGYCSFEQPTRLSVPASITMLLNATTCQLPHVRPQKHAETSAVCVFDQPCFQCCGRFPTPLPLEPLPLTPRDVCAAAFQRVLEEEGDVKFVATETLWDISISVYRQAAIGWVALAFTGEWQHRNMHSRHLRGSLRLDLVARETPVALLWNRMSPRISRAVPLQC